MKKLALALSVVMLAACGESKITKVDGTNVTTADQTLKAMGKELNQNDSIEYLVNIRMLHSRYDDAEFAKKLDGMDMAEVKQEFAATKSHFIDLNRERFVQIEQVEIDRLTDKVARVSEGRRKMEENFDPTTSIWTASDLARIEELKRRQVEYRTQDAEEFFKIHGCGCMKSQLPPTAKYM